MKKYFLILSAMLMSVVSLLTSCVDSDMYGIYDDDGMELMFSRKKATKDIPSNGYNSGTSGGGAKPSYIINNFIAEGCCRRTLEAFCIKWNENYENILIQAMNQYFDNCSKNDKLYLNNRYCNNPDKYSDWQKKRNNYMSSDKIFNELNTGNVIPYVMDIVAKNHNKKLKRRTGSGLYNIQVGDVVRTKEWTQNNEIVGHDQFVVEAWNWTDDYSRRWYKDSDGNSWRAVDWVDIVYYLE